MKHTITIYTTQTCPYCKMAKEYFASKKIAFTEINVAADALKTPEMIQKSGQTGVPVIDVGGTIIVGFDQARIEAALGLD